MAHFDPIPRDVLESIAGKLSERLSPEAGAARAAGIGVEIAETLAVWQLGLDATTKTGQDISDLAINTGYWHHQIRHGPTASEFARSTPLGPAPNDWQVEETSTSPLANKVQSGIDWIDQNVHDDPTVRLLVIPSYYIHALWLTINGSSRVLIIDKPDQYKLLDYNRLYTSNEFLDILAQESHAKGLPPIPRNSNP